MAQSVSSRVSSIPASSGPVAHLELPNGDGTQCLKSYHCTFDTRSLRICFVYFHWCLLSARYQVSLAKHFTELPKEMTAFIESEITEGEYSRRDDLEGGVARRVHSLCCC